MAHRRMGVIILALVVALMISACDIEGVNLDMRGSQPMGIGLNPAGPDYEVEFDPAIVEAAEGFGLDVYKRLLEESDDGAGVFISPASIAMALAMTYNGADGDTKAAMAEALGVDQLSLEQLNDGYYALIRALNEAVGDPDQLQLIIANGIWQRQGVDYYEDFLERNQQFYGATVRSLDFDDPDSINVINNWVSVQTAGRIPNLIEEIRPDSEMFLINAIYFKGNWSKPFDPAASHTGEFQLPNGRTSQVTFMRQDGSFDYYQGDGFQAVRLPYGEDERIAMYVFLPDEESDLAAFHQQLTQDNFNAWLQGFDEKEGLVALPRFQMEFKASLNDALKDLGMDIAFDSNQADFSRMRPVSPADNLYIGDVLHQTFLLVNEEGTEAAGATSVEMRLTSVPVDTFNFVADRPFFLTIRDDETGALLFAGSVADPSAVE